MQIHTHTCTYNQCHEEVLWCCCERTRLLCAEPPTQISLDGAQDGISMQPLRVKGPWAAQGSCSPHPRRVQRARARQNGSGNGSLIAGYSGRAAAHGCPEWGPLVAAPSRDVSGLLWAPTHKRVYVACMWLTYVYMYHQQVAVCVISCIPA